MAKRKWFISHPSGAYRHTPVFFDAIEQFSQEEKNKVEMILPRDEQGEHNNTKMLIEEADLVIAEVSIASTGSGIELGWASAAGKDIVIFHQGAEVASPALQFVTQKMHSYITEDDIVLVLKQLL